MKEKNNFICEYCDKSFVTKYSVPQNKVIHYCSKSCKTKQQIITSKNYIFYNKETLELSISQLIMDEKRYLTRTEICQLLNVSSKTLNKFKVSILDLNKKCGFKKVKSKFEEQVFECLIEIFGIQNIKRQKSFNDCLSPKGYLLYFDFYIDNKKMIIEADGNQHVNKNNPWHSEYYCIDCDNIKDNYCMDKNITLIRIPYKRNFDISYIKELVS